MVFVFSRLLFCKTARATSISGGSGDAGLVLSREQGLIMMYDAGLEDAVLPD